MAQRRIIEMKISFKVPKLLAREALAEKIFHFVYDLPKIDTLWSLIWKGKMERAVSIEIGLYKITGTGTVEIPYIRRYRNPGILKTTIGYVEVMGIKIPVPLFLIGVEEDRMKYIHFIGESYLFFIVIGY